MRGPGSYVHGLDHNSDRAPAPIRPFLIVQDAWPQVGLATRNTMGAKRSIAVTVPPVGLSFLTQLKLARNDDTTVGIVKVLACFCYLFLCSWALGPGCCSCSC